MDSGAFNHAFFGRFEIALSILALCGFFSLLGLWGYAFYALVKVMLAYAGVA